MVRLALASHILLHSASRLFAHVLCNLVELFRRSQQVFDHHRVSLSFRNSELNGTYWQLIGHRGILGKQLREIPISDNVY
jgi:hypothetical protein